MSKINHTKGTWRITGAYKHLIDNGTEDSPVICEIWNRKEDDATLVSIAKTAPHECDDPKCPGNINRQIIEMFPKLMTMIENINNRYSHYFWDSDVDAIRQRLIRARALQEAMK
jgi:hypothetical protein